LSGPPAGNVTPSNEDAGCHSTSTESVVPVLPTATASAERSVKPPSRLVSAVKSGQEQFSTALARALPLDEKESAPWKKSLVSAGRVLLRSKTVWLAK